MMPSIALAAPAVTESLDESSWDGFVEQHPGASGYHPSAWRAIFEEVFGHRTHYLSARRGDRVVGVLPFVEFRSRLFGRFGVSLPFVNQGGVVAEDEGVARALVDRAIEVARSRGLAHLELRHEHRRFPDLTDKPHKVSMRLPLPETSDGLWNSLDRKARNQVRKSEKSGLAADIGGVELVGAFYRVFSENMRDLGTPVYPRAFFEAVMTGFPDRTRIHVVRLGDEVVASSLTIAWRNSVEVPWASSLRRHRDKSPNNLLYWSMLQQAVADHRRVFDFGRSTPNEGTYHFKAQWGAEPGPMHWEYWLARDRSLPNQSPSNPKFSAAVAVWQRLPLSIANRLGPAIVRNIP